MATPATTIIQSLRKGNLNEEMGEQLASVVERVKATGKKAKLILTLTIEPAGVNKDDRDLVVEKVWIRDEIKLALPKLPVNPTLLFIKEDSNDLTKDAPQTSIHGVRDSA